MNARILKAALLGAVAMFFWTFLAHMVLPLGEAGVRQITNEGPLRAHMAAVVKEQGLYLFPNMPADRNQADYYKDIATGPSGMLIYFPKRDFSFGQTLAAEFLTEFAQSLLAVWLLSMTSFTTFSGRLGFFSMLGLLAAITTNISYWNWYGFPADYTLGVMVTTIMSFICAGAVAAWMKIGGQQSGPKRAAFVRV
jgi:hypothetical protein